MSKVSLVKTTDHEVGVKESISPFIERLRKETEKLSHIVIKVNFVTTELELAMTPFEAVKSFIDTIQEFYTGEIIIAEEATNGDTKAAFVKFGFSKLAHDNDQVKLLDIGDDKKIEIDLEYDDKILRLPFSRTIVEAPFLVSITRPKTHDTVVVTLGIKNVLVGAIKGRLTERVKIHKGKDIHKILTSIAKHTYPDFVILDGVEGMEGDGPDCGTSIKPSWALSSFDALSADTLGAYLMGFDFDDIGYFNMIRDEGLGKAYPADDIEIIEENPKDLRKQFKPHRTIKNQKKWR